VGDDVAVYGVLNGHSGVVVLLVETVLASWWVWSWLAISCLIGGQG